MRHAKRNQRLSRPSEHRNAILHTLVRDLILHGQIRTTLARAKEAQRLADRLVSLGKDGSLHARRRAFRILQDRTVVAKLFGTVAPVFVDIPGGYTRVVRLGIRRGDGAQQALFAFSRQPLGKTAPAAGAKPVPAPHAPATPGPAKPEQPKAEKPKKFLEGLRSLWTRKKKGAVVPSGSVR